MHPIAEPIRGVLAICGRAVSLLARLFDLSRLRGELPQADGADDGRLQSRLAGALPRLRAPARPLTGLGARSEHRARRLASAFR